MFRHVSRSEEREPAVKETGTLKQEYVIKAIDHAKITEGPGSPAAMVPGQHHVRMNMYIAQAKIDIPFGRGN